MSLAVTTIRDYRITLILTGLGACLLISILFSLATGAVAIPVRDVVIILLHKIGLLLEVPVDQTYDIVLSSIRIPRIFMTVLIGAALGVSGTALQGLFRNPLVEPGLIGVSGGAASAVVLVIVFGTSWALPSAGLLHNGILSLVAFGGGVLVSIIVLRLSSQLGKTNVAVLILTGVAVNALASAVIGLSIFYADENQLRAFTFWTLGNLGGATWDKLMIASPVMVGATVALLFFSRALNALVLGESEAYYIGVHVERTKKLIIVFAALAVAISVSLAGIIGFVGLVVPHVIRVSFYSDNRLVLPASVIGGALLLVLSDIIARTIVTPAELPTGVVTAFIGAPFFMGLLMKAKRKNEL
jgi:iron complex transport system permease protein